MTATNQQIQNEMATAVVFGDRPRYEAAREQLNVANQPTHAPCVDCGAISYAGRSSRAQAKIAAGEFRCVSCAQLFRTAQNDAGDYYPSLGKVLKPAR